MQTLYQNDYSQDKTKIDLVPIYSFNSKWVAVTKILLFSLIILGFSILFALGSEIDDYASLKSLGLAMIFIPIFALGLWSNLED